MTWKEFKTEVERQGVKDTDEVARIQSEYTNLQKVIVRRYGTTEQICIIGK